MKIEVFRLGLGEFLGSIEKRKTEVEGMQGRWGEKEIKQFQELFIV